MDGVIPGVPAKTVVGRCFPLIFVNTSHETPRSAQTFVHKELKRDMIEESLCKTVLNTVYGFCGH